MSAVPEQTPLQGAFSRSEKVPDGQPLEQAVLRPGEERSESVSLQGIHVGWIDQLLPASPRRFLIVVAALAAGVWLVGLLLAGDSPRFLKNREWQIQPLYLAGHLIALRLFVTACVVNYLDGVRHLRIEPDLAWTRLKHVLQPVGGLLALSVAAPFCIVDILELRTEEYREYLLNPDLGIRAIDVYMAAVWCAEWIINAYIWTLLIGFLLLVVWTLRGHAFKAPIDVMLVERHYRPFLLISVQGATILIFFGAVTGLYVWYAEGELSDYLGLGITVALLLTGFVPPWLMLRSRLEAQLQLENQSLGQRMLSIRQVRDAEPGSATMQDLAVRLEEAVTMLRMSYLDRLREELGKAEGRAVVMRLLVPMSTMAWKFIRPFIPGI